MAGKIWWTVAITAVVAFIVITFTVIIGTISTFNVVKASTNELVNILKNTSNELTRVNNQLSTLHQLNTYLTNIESGIKETKGKIDSLSNETSQIEYIKHDIKNISNTLILVERKYPPSQNFLIQGISNENLSNALSFVFEPQIKLINKKIKSLSFNFFWTLFNSLFSVSIIGITVFIIFKKKSS